MAPHITIAAAILFTLFLTAYFVFTRWQQTPQPFEFTKTGLVALTLSGASLAIGGFLLSIRNWPWEIAVPIVWFLFPLMVVAALASLFIGMRSLHTLYRPLEVSSVGANAITIIAIVVWVLLPRFLYS